jgi:hypothetical protein
MTGRQVPDVLLRSARRQIGNERGAVLALVTLLLIVFLGLAALAIDLGLMYVARGEAQRSADAGAHAGAGWLMHNPGASEADIRAAAIEFGTRNLVRGSEVVIKDEDVEILWDERKVRVTAHRTGAEENPVRTLFAGVLGIQTVDVAAVAAAQIWPGEGSDCILPFAIPDHWYVNDGGTLRDATIGDTYIGSRGDSVHSGKSRPPVTIGAWGSRGTPAMGRIGSGSRSSSPPLIRVRLAAAGLVLLDSARGKPGGARLPGTQS